MLPQALRIFKHKSVFIKMLLLFNTFVVMMILAFGYISYTKSASLLISEVVESNNQYLELARSNIDNTLVSLDSLSFQISLQDDIWRSLYLSEQTWDLDQLLYMNIIKYLKSIKLSNPMISDIWLQYYRFPVVINHESKYNQEHYYKQIYETKPSLPWQERPKFHSISYLGPMKKLSVAGDSSEVITFARSVPFSDISPTGMLHINLNTENLSRTLQNRSDPYPAFMYAIDREGTLLFSSTVQSEQDQIVQSSIGAITEQVMRRSEKKGHLEETVSGNDYQIVFTSSRVNDWTYISAVPTAFIKAKANQFREFTWFAASLCLAGGLILSYFLINQIYRPINKIVSYIDMFGRKHPEENRRSAEDELGFIDRIINYAYYEVHHLRDTFEKNAPKLRQNFLYDLLEGRLSSANVKDAAEELQLPFHNDTFQIIVFETVDFSLDDAIGTLGHDMTAVFDELAIGIGGTAIRSIRKRNDKMVSILNLQSSHPNPEAASEYIRKVLGYFQHTYSRTFTVGVGRVYGRAEEIPLSYVDALSSLQYKVVKGQGSIIFVDEVTKLPESSFHYTFDMEKQLINAIKTGNAESLARLLDHIWTENLDKKVPTLEIIHNLFHALAGTTIRTIYELGANSGDIFGEDFDLYRELNQQTSIAEKKACIERAMTMISDCIRVKQQGQYAKLLNQIKLFVDSHYQQDLSQSMLSEHLGLSASYVSSIFKEVTGLNFADYVNSRRIEQAKDLLRLSDESIVEIADKVGFSNSNTFIRVFKRHEGITPGQYRQLDHSASEHETNGKAL
jgi:two-component system, response regulator YesN